MKDEIKEINIPENVLVALGDLTNCALNYYKATETVKVKHNTILDYITNLQEENEKLNNIIEQLEKWCNEEMYADDQLYEKVLDKLQELKGSDNQ